MSWLYFLSFGRGSWPRVVSGFLVSVGLLFLLLSLSVLAQTVYVKGSVVNVRLGPGTQYKVVNRVRKGHPVRIIGSEGNWYFVEFEDDRGWIYGGLVASWKKIDLSYLSLDKAQPAWVSLFKDVSGKNVILENDRSVPLNQVRIINPSPLTIRDVTLEVVEGERENLLGLSITVDGMSLIERLTSQEALLSFKGLIFQKSIGLPARQLITWNQEIHSQSVRAKEAVEILLLGKPDFSEVVLSEKTKILVLVYSTDLVLLDKGGPAKYYLWAAEEVELPGLSVLIGEQEEKW